MENISVQLSVSLQNQIESHAIAFGGYPSFPGGMPRPDSTAWAVLALASSGATKETLRPARQYLVDCQTPDGCVPLDKDHPLVWWPTALAMLAWLGPEEFAKPRSKAAAFLLLNTGLHHQPDPNGILKHNTALRGWPWVAGTHSWVEPTAIAVLALRANGHADHPRVSEAVRMLMDRRLGHGGWNYGNTVVFGAELKPMPDATGMALAALQGMVSRDDIQSGLDYLVSEFDQCLTPQTFAWGRLGLAAWEMPIGGIDPKVERILGRQARLGPYDTSALGQLLVAFNATEGIMRLAEKMNRGAI